MHCVKGVPYKKCVNSTTYLYCSGTSKHAPVSVTCPEGTYCACDGYCNSTLFSQPCLTVVPPVGGGGDLPEWPAEQFTSVFIGNVTYVAGANVIETLIPSAQLWFGGNGKYLAKWFQTVNGAAQSQFKLLTPPACLFFGDELLHGCSVSASGSLDDFKLGLVIPPTTVLLSQSMNELGEIISVYFNQAGCPLNPPTSTLCLRETWTFNENTQKFLSYQREESGVGYTSVELIDFLWVVVTPVNQNLFIKPSFCTAVCP
eukprot:TRINITY_DN3285_c0_g2_i2.p1 TRINITY_DN3285_c0_g2~~TRINITY_DN3285_c0_g2_i2.p1  ORF type:complete len:258 (+),score=42.69 TRINITY_DN3285_c0_g2_i2:131-904(+)